MGIIDSTPARAEAIEIIEKLSSFERRGNSIEPAVDTPVPVPVPAVRSRLRAALSWTLRRAQEPSSWRGLALVLGALGAAIEPSYWEAFTAAAMAVAGFIGMVTGDRAEP
jgi:hypothetical protein